MKSEPTAEVGKTMPLIDIPTGLDIADNTIFSIISDTSTRTDLGAEL